jgi:O-antigen ligase
MLVIAFKNKQTRNAAFYAFLLAMLITCGISLLKFLNLISFKKVNDAGDLFHNHITTGYFMAFAAFIAAFFSLKAQGFAKFFFIGLTLLFSFHVLFINPARTGYLVFSILTILFIMQFISWRNLPIYILVILPLTLISLYQIPLLRYRTALVFQDYQNFKAGNKNTSIGYRLQFSQYANKLFHINPIFGLGTASFSHYFAKEQPIPSWRKKLLDPHNQYWLMAVEFGIAGFFAFLYFLLAIFLAVDKKHTNYFILLGLISTFLIANCIDSFFLYSSTGYFFILFAALALGETWACSSQSIEKPQMEDRVC